MLSKLSLRQSRANPKVFQRQTSFTMKEKNQTKTPQFCCSQEEKGSMSVKAQGSRGTFDLSEKTHLLPLQQSELLGKVDSKSK